MSPWGTPTRLVCDALSAGSQGKKEEGTDPANMALKMMKQYEKKIMTMVTGRLFSTIHAVVPFEATVAALPYAP